MYDPNFLVSRANNLALIKRYHHRLYIDMKPVLPACRRRYCQMANRRITDHDSLISSFVVRLGFSKKVSEFHLLKVYTYRKWMHFEIISRRLRLENQDWFVQFLFGPSFSSRKVSVVEFVSIWESLVWFSRFKHYPKFHGQKPAFSYIERWYCSLEKGDCTVLTKVDAVFCLP